MAASKSVSWSTSKAGYDPGQKQSLTVSFKKRVYKKITCHVSFSAISLGRDDYTVSQRHNHATVSIQRKTDNGTWVTVGSHSWNYQLHGSSGTSTSHSSNFSFEGPYGVTTFRVIYNNARVGTNTPNYGPKSTGKVSNANIGTLKVDDCGKITIKYHAGINEDAYDEDDKVYLNAANLPESKEIYWGKNFTVSENIPYDTYANYVFTGWDDGTDWKVNSKTKKKRKINVTAPKYVSGSKYKKAEGNIHLYACWTPAIFDFRFYPTQVDAENRTNEWTELLQHRTFGQAGVEIPDVIKNPSVTSKYYKRGYKCIGWQHWLNTQRYKDDPVEYPRIHTHLFDDVHICTAIQSVHSWPVWIPNEGSVLFDYGYDNRTYLLSSYSSDTELSLIKYCTSEDDGLVVKPTEIRAGYRLVGWSTKKPDKDYYLIGDKLPEHFQYDAKWSSVIDEGDTITLYAVWQIESTLYVYTSQSISDDTNGINWKLVVPYVYCESSGEWKQSIANAYTSLYKEVPGDQNPRWKL